MALSTKQKKYITEQSEKVSAQIIAQKLNLTETEVQDFIATIPTSSVTPNRNRLFTILAVSIPFLFFIFLELGLRIGNYKGDLSLFVFPDDLKGEYGFPNQDYAKRYFFNTKVIPNPSRDPFLTHKPDSSFRVFVLGESSAVGYPYGFNIKFSAIVKDALSDMLPNKVVEVVNLGTSAINTYTIYDQVDEVLEQKPDAILIYTGHNEFYGALGVGSSESLGAFPAFVRFYLKIQRLKTFLLLRDVMNSAITFIKGEPDKSGTLMERVVEEQEIPLESDLYKLGKIQFESNMRVIVNAFREKGIPVYLSSLASNLKDQTPFVSVENSIYPKAIDVYNAGKEAYSQQNYHQADSLFTLARDLDALRFRATSGFNAFIKQLATETNSVYVPGEEAFRSNSPHGIIGNELLLEHLHPNAEGYQLLGKTFVESIIQHPPKNLVLDKNLFTSWDDYNRRLFISDFDTTLGNFKIVKLRAGWPFIKAGEKTRPYHFIKKNIADSIAEKTVMGKLTWEPSKVELAETYTKRKQFDLAILEYMGIIKDTPYNASPYVFAAQLYLEQNKLDLAEPLLRKANSLEKNAFVSKMLGSIEVNNKNFVQGIYLLRESLALNDKDPQAWYNLSGALAFNNEIDEALKAAKQAQVLSPNFPNITNWIANLKQIKNKR